MPDSSGRTTLAVTGALVLVVAGYVLYRIAAAPSQPAPAEVRATHVKDSTPRHGQVLPGSPTNVVLDLDLDAVAGTTVSVTAHGEEFAVGETIIDANPLAVRREVSADLPDGKYIVAYTLCTTDDRCEDGSLHFSVDRATAGEVVDLRGQSVVDVRMERIAFAPANIRIDRGTTVRWTNHELLEHFVNTDSHPYHTYFLAQNSRGLKQGATYEARFDQPGWYPYHCSAHADQMQGGILVE